MEIGRTSCTSFWANQFRVLMTAAPTTDAGTALRWLARSARGHKFHSASTLPELGVQVVATVRRVVLHLPQASPIAIAFIVSL